MIPHSVLTPLQTVDVVHSHFSNLPFKLIIRNVGNGIQILKEKVVQDNGRADNCLYVCYFARPYLVQEGRPPFLETAKTVLFPYSCFFQGSVITFNLCEKFWVCDFANFSAPHNCQQCRGAREPLISDEILEVSWQSPGQFCLRVTLNNKLAVQVKLHSILTTHKKMSRGLMKDLVV